MATDRQTVHRCRALLVNDPQRDYVLSGLGVCVARVTIGGGGIGVVETVPIQIPLVVDDRPVVGSAPERR